MPDKKKGKTGVYGLNKNLLEKIKKLGTKSSRNNQEGFLLYTDFYLDRLIADGNIFNNIKSNQYINKLQIYNINPEIFEYLEGAINICNITEKEKYLRKYMPEIINLFFKLNFAHTNYIRENNGDMNISQSQTQSISEENVNKFIYLFIK